MVFTAVANIDLTDALWPGATRVSGTFPVTLQRSASSASADASTQVEGNVVSLMKAFAGLLSWNLTMNKHVAS